MSNAFFHLLGPGTQPDDASFSMNPYRSPVRSMATQVWRRWSAALTARR